MSRHGRGGTGVKPAADRDVRHIVKSLLEDWTLSDPNSKSHARLLETLARYDQVTTSEGAPNEEWLRVIQISIETSGGGDHVVEAVEQCVVGGETAALVELLHSVGADPATAPAWKELLEPQQLRRILDDEALDPEIIGRVLARAGVAEVPVLTDRVRALESGPVRRLVVEPEFRAQAQRLRQVYAGSDGAGQAASAITRYLASMAKVATAQPVLREAAA